MPDQIPVAATADETIEAALLAGAFWRTLDGHTHAMKMAMLRSAVEALLHPDTLHRHGTVVALAADAGLRWSMPEPRTRVVAAYMLLADPFGP